MKIRSVRGLEFVVISIFILIGGFCSAQCPRGLNQVTTAPQDNLVLYLPLDGNTDNYGSGAFSAGPTEATFVPGKCNAGLRFDGVDDYLEISPSLDLIDDFTITAWVKPDEQLSSMGIFSIREQCTDTYRGYAMVQLSLNPPSGGGYTYQVNKHRNCTGFSGGDRYVNSDISIADNEYVFVAVTVQRNSSEDRQVTLYVNCEEYSTEMSLDHPTSETFSSLRDYVTTIGASSKVNDYFNSFKGVIDEVSVYSEAFNHESLLDVYYQCMPLGIEASGQQDCDQDSTFIAVYNTDRDVRYQIVDANSNQLISNPLDGNCDSLSFRLGPLSEPAVFQIQAEHLLSGCTVLLDTIINIDAYTEFVYVDNVINLCEGDSVLIDNVSVYTNASSIDTIYSSMFCDSIVNTSYVFTPYPTIELGEDTTLCIGDILYLDVSNSRGEYVWQDGSTNPRFEVDMSGEYAVSVENDCGVSLDEIKVEVKECCSLYIPNAFSPNADGINDSFKVLSAIGSCDNNSSFSMRIFNRWGALVFESNDIDIGWDGTFGGKDSNEGIYAYLIEYSNGLNPQLFEGNIALVK